MRTLRFASTVALSLALATSFVGCAAEGSSPTPSSAGSSSPGESQGSASATGAPTPTATEPACDTVDSNAVVLTAVRTLPAPEGLESAKWDESNVDTSGFDPCAELSWAVVSLEMATVSSPTAVLLFHDGSYLGTTTSEEYGFTPRVERTAPGAISVTYPFLQGNESNAEASGRATASYTWNDSTQSVDMAGETPPA